jgi:hypothetical protein
MKKFFVEMQLPGAGNLTPEELQELLKAFHKAISTLGRPFTWIHSFVTEDKIYCIHIAESENDVREHAKHSNFYVHVVEEIKLEIDPSSGKISE